MKKLIRPLNDRVLGGVCAGIARNWSSETPGLIEIDPTWVRILWAIGTIVTGFVFGIAAYLICWIIIPSE